MRSIARLLAISALLALTVGLPSRAFARPAPVTVLVGTEVSTAATGTMSPGLWSRVVADWVNAKVVPVAGKPTLEDCKRAKAGYVVYAPFDLTPRLPGSLHVNDRISAVSHIVATNCIDGRTVFDQVVSLESNPVSIANEGDYEPVPEITWERSVRGALAKYNLGFSAVARVVRIEGPFVYVEMPSINGIATNTVLRIFADGDAQPKKPVFLTVTDIVGKNLVQTLYDQQSGAVVKVNDLVEPVKP